jgi:hypothetical protein
VTTGGIKLPLSNPSWHNGNVARNAVWQFRRSKEPHIGMLRRFAQAADLSIEELVGGRAGKRKK